MERIVNPEDYLENNLKSEYKKRPATFPILITKDRTIPFELRNQIYCTGRIEINKQWYALIHDDQFDGAIIYGLPHSIRYTIEYPKIWKLVKWIQTKLFEFQIETAENQQFKTELCRLRMIDNFIMQSEHIEHNDRMKWAIWIKELFWQRKKLLHEWYMRYVLPF